MLMKAAPTVGNAPRAGDGAARGNSPANARQERKKGARARCEAKAREGIMLRRSRDARATRGRRARVAGARDTGYVGARRVGAPR